MSQITFLIKFLVSFPSKITAVFYSWDVVGILELTTATALDIATFQRQNTSNAVADEKHANWFHDLLLYAMKRPVL